ncbi:hypothetical protein SALB1_2052 [Salinisphaera sp. LB1]|nr:hypothetical protein SALB1_2052 [Salinisphaera sp. LB1]
MLRRAVVYNGRSRNTAWFSIIDGEWPAIADQESVHDPHFAARGLIHWFHRTRHY